MTTYFISRHLGAKVWAAQTGFKIDKQVSHFEPRDTQSGDRILGTLPVHLAAIVCARGGLYYHLSLNIPPDLRGKELSVEEMLACDARLEQYEIKVVTPK